MGAFIEAALIQRKDGQFVNDSSYAMWRGCSMLGVETRFFEAEEAGSMPLSREVVVHGWIGPVRGALKRLGCEQPGQDSAPEPLLPLFGRRLWETTLGEVRRARKPVFIKPLRDHKLFTGHVVKGKLRDLIQTAGLDDSLELLASEVVDFVAEYRVFVHRGTMIGCRHYLGDFAVPPDLSVAREAIRLWRSAPVAHSVDLGVTADGRTLLVEVNDAFSLGCYGLPAIPYAHMVMDRWEEMVSGSPPPV